MIKHKGEFLKVGNNSCLRQNHAIQIIVKRKIRMSNSNVDCVWIKKFTGKKEETVIKKQKQLKGRKQVNQTNSLALFICSSLPITINESPSLVA
jgi:hypothetical protein